MGNEEFKYIVKDLLVRVLFVSVGLSLYFGGTYYAILKGYL